MRLVEKKIYGKLENLRGWRLNSNVIKRTFGFSNFLESIDFVNKVAQIAEDANHHPDIKISYNKVTITLSTHDEGGVTEKDINLAIKINSLI